MQKFCLIDDAPHRRRRFDCPPGQPVFLLTGFRPCDSAWSIFARNWGFLRGAIVPVACVYCRTSTDIMSAAIMSADVMFMPDALAWQAKYACYLYEVIKIMKNNVILTKSWFFDQNIVFYVGKMLFWGKSVNKSWFQMIVRLELSPISAVDRTRKLLGHSFCGVTG